MLYYRRLIRACLYKANLTLCLVDHSMKAYGGVEVYRHALLFSEPDGAHWSASSSVSGAHSIGCIRPRAVLDAVDKCKNLFLFPGSSVIRSVVLVTIQARVARLRTCHVHLWEHRMQRKQLAYVMFYVKMTQWRSLGHDHNTVCGCNV
jgi:hypothetical protein